jgi:hypothetical protein
VATTSPKLLAALCALVLAGCPQAASAPADAGPTPAPSASAPGPTATAVATAKASADPDDAPSDGATRKHPEVKAIHFASDVKNKEPVDNLSSTPPGKRVYAHLLVRNRTAGTRVVTLKFSVDGAERSTVDLEVERSWGYRTWAYVTLKPTDKGALRVVVTDDVGSEPIARAEIPIKP